MYLYCWIAEWVGGPFTETKLVFEDSIFCLCFCLMMFDFLLVRLEIFYRRDGEIEISNWRSSLCSFIYVDF